MQPAGSQPTQNSLLGILDEWVEVEEALSYFEGVHELSAEEEESGNSSSEDTENVTSSAAYDSEDGENDHSRSPPKLTARQKKTKKPSAAAPSASENRDETHNVSDDPNDDDEAFHQYYFRPKKTNKLQVKREARFDQCCKVPEPTEQNYVFDRIPQDNEKYKNEIEEKIFDKLMLWKVYCLQGYSVFLTGIGSKFRILQTFAHNCLRDGPCVILRGGSAVPRLSDPFCEVLRTCFKVKPKTKVFASVVDCLIANLESSSNDDFLNVAIHSFDDDAFRPHYPAFARLAGHWRVRLVASVDILYPSLLFSPHETAQFLPYYETCHTYRDYRREVQEKWPDPATLPEYIRTYAQPESEGEEWATFEEIFRTTQILLTDHNRKVMKLVLELILKQPGSGRTRQIALSEVVKNAKMLGGTSAEITRHLREPLDLKLLEKTMTRGATHYCVPAPDKTIKKMLEILEV